MNNPDFTMTFLVSQSPEEVFDAINDVRTWWSEEFKGSTEKPGDEFEVRFADVHYSRQKLIASVPGKKLVWLVTDSRLTFLKDESEWTGTRIEFDITEENGKTRIGFIHHGLVPTIQCFRDCSNGWNHYLGQSLIPFIQTGKANPNVLNKEVREKSNMK